eukprot:TRINITY_DN55955_c0_g1_i1.p1 TRINITY_DN55955_c0_g1~~TRINITY_DN55955_c0_g1_i1.p1  ORF type:complete len:253 (+),score=32.66 TRINITY_DN55955_c0_g1_i1:55-813(+)
MFRQALSFVERRSFLYQTVRWKRTHANIRTELQWRSANLSSEAAADHIRWLLTQRNDGDALFRKVMTGMKPDQRRRIGLGWAMGELRTEFEKADKDRDGVITAEEFMKWGEEITASGPHSSNDCPASNVQLQRLFLRQVAPFVGFGFVDNALMVLSGEVLDLYLGAMFGISTLAAAALGNAFSNGIGMGLHGVIERTAASIGLKDPELTMQQMKQRRVHLTKTAGGIVGITIGCLLGMCPLLFMNTTSSHGH